MTARTSIGTYQVAKMGSFYFVVIRFLNGEQDILVHKHYRTEAGATKGLISYCASAGIKLMNESNVISIR